MSLIISNTHCRMYLLFFTLFLCFSGVQAAVKAQDEAPPADSKEETQKAAPEPVVEDTEWDNVTVEFKEAKLTSGGTLTLKFKYSNSGSDPIDISRVGKFDHDDVIEHVYFVDTANNKKYLVVKDTEGKPLGTNLKYFVLGAGESKNAWAKFPAPPEGVETITIYLPGAPPIEDVAIVK
ncbi:MAG: hypothetical protein AB1598_08300 [Thermodesulfobacteriota bacterium]